jgi:hypothetical protein
MNDLARQLAKEVANLDTATEADLIQAVADYDRNEADIIELNGKRDAYREVVQDILKTRLQQRDFRLEDGRLVRVSTRKNESWDQDALREFLKKKDAEYDGPGDKMLPHVFQQQVVIRFRVPELVNRIIRFLKFIKERHDDHLVATQEEVFDEGTLNYFLEREHRFTLEELKEAGVYRSNPTEYVVIPKPGDKD